MNIALNLNKNYIIFMLFGFILIYIASINNIDNVEHEENVENKIYKIIKVIVFVLLGLSIAINVFLLIISVISQIFDISTVSFREYQEKGFIMIIIMYAFSFILSLIRLFNKNIKRLVDFNYLILFYAFLSFTIAILYF